MKYIIRFLSIILIGIAVCIGYNTWTKQQVFEHGITVTARVVDVPIDCNSGRRIAKPHFRFYLEGKVYTKRLNDNYCKSIAIAPYIDLKTNTDRTVFVYIDETFKGEYIALVIILIIAGLCFVKSLK